jgi:hypothetical protein
MFLHQVKMNWKKYRRLMGLILAFSLVRIYVEVGLGWAPMNYLASLKFVLGALAVTIALAFLKTLWDLGTAYGKKLCTFAVAVRRFSRDYWSTRKLAA